MTPTSQAFFQHWESFCADQSEDRDVRPLLRSALANMQAGVDFPQLAPCLAAIYFATVEHNLIWWKDAILRPIIRFGIWLMRKWIYRHRPMWNDFYMGLWLLSRDPYYVGRLYVHLKRATNADVRFTGQWMVTSVCQQDEGFRKCWEMFAEKMGPIFV